MKHLRTYENFEYNFYDIKEGYVYRFDNMIIYVISKSEESGLIYSIDKRTFGWVFNVWYSLDNINSIICLGTIEKYLEENPEDIIVIESLYNSEETKRNAEYVFDEWYEKFSNWELVKIYLESSELGII